MYNKFDASNSVDVLLKYNQLPPSLKYLHYNSTNIVTVYLPVVVVVTGIG